MRVLQLLPSLGDGGVERSAVEHAGGLSAYGIENWVVSGGGRLAEAVVAAGSKHLTMPVGRKSPLAIVRNARRLAGLIDELGIDIVHSRSRAPAWAGYLAARYSRRHPAFLATFHGVYGHSSRVKRWYNSVMLRGEVVIANSAFIANHLSAVYGVDQDRIVLAPRGVDPAVFDPANVSDATVARFRSEFSAGDIPLLVYVSRISGWKGHATLVEALETVVDRPWKAVFVGGHDSDARRDELLARIGSGPARGRILLTGSRSDIPAILKAADLAFSVATAPEAFGRATIEAGAMATPVVATAHGGSLETVRDGETGWLVPPGDAKALAEAITVALDNPADTLAMGRAARTHVLGNFTIERTLAAERSAYDRVLRSARYGS